MAIKFSVTGEELDKLRRHLFQSKLEQVAFAFAGVLSENNHVIFKPSEWYFIPSEDFSVQSAWNVELKDEARIRIIKRAWEQRLSLVEVHSHLSTGFSAQFSPSDITGLKDFVPHLWWRLQGLPYLALVFQKKGFDAMAWFKEPGSPEPLDCILVDSRNKLRPTNITFSRWFKNNQHGR